MDGRPYPGSAAPVDRGSMLLGRRRFRLGFGLCLILTLALLVLTATAFADVPGTTVWSHTWNASPAGTVQDVAAAQAPAGGLYVTATVRKPGGDIDIVLLKYAANGKRLWTRWYDGPSHGADRAGGIAAGPDGSVTVCGSTGVAGAGLDWIVLKYASNGTRRWAKRLSGDAGRNDRAVDIVVDSAGNAVVVGSIARVKTGVDWCVAKFAPNGFRRWRASMSTDGAAADQANAVTFTGSGRIAVAGQFTSKARGIDAVLAGYTSKGRLTWRQTMQGLSTSDDVLLAVAARAGRVAAVGQTHGPIGGADALIVSCAADGSARWDKPIDGGAAGADRFSSVAVDAGGNVIAAGGMTATAPDGSDAFVGRYAAANGSELDAWRADDGPDDSIAAVRLIDGDVFAAGRLGRAGAPAALLAGLRPDLAALWPTLTLATGAAATTVVPADGAVLVVGTKGTSLLVAKVAR